MNLNSPGEISSRAPKRPGTPLRAVVLGTGGQGMRRAQALRLARGWAIAGVHDLDAASAQAASKRLRCPAWPDLRTAIESSHADVVFVATPPFVHDEQIEAALAANCHVFCEKPLTIRHDSAERMASEAERRGLVFSTGFNHRFFAPVGDLLSLIRSDRLGQIRKIDAFIGHPPSEATLGGWLGDRSRSGGGVLTDNGSHLIDLLRMFLGEIRISTVDDIRWHPDREGIETTVRFRGRNESGAVAFAHCSWEDPHRKYLSIDIEFERGMARMSAFPWSFLLFEDGRLVTRKNYWPERFLGKFLGLRAPGLEASLIRELAAVRSAILGQPAQGDLPPFATARDGARVATIVETVTSKAVDSQLTDPAETTLMPAARLCA